MVAPARARQMGWAVILSCCFAALLALTFKVNAVKSEVRLAERHIVAAENAKVMLETEFQTRASQHQLSDWNEVEFGYAAPRADQYLENERQLAALGAPRGIGAPRPVRVALARADIAPAEDSVLGDIFAADDAGEESDDTPPARDTAAPRLAAASSLAQRLARPSAATTAVVAVAEVGE